MARQRVVGYLAAGSSWVAILVVGLAALAVPTWAAEEGGDWPSFRGSPDLSGVAHSPLPEKPVLLWTAEAGGGISNCPAIAGDTVYVATGKGTVRALNLADGKPKWTTQLSGSFSSSPAIADGKVFVGGEDGFFHALDAKDGKEIWKFEAKGQIVSSATPAPKGLVLFGSDDNNLYCLDMKTGEKKWAVERAMQVECTPCVAGDLVCIGGCDGTAGQIQAFQLEDGKEGVSSPLFSTGVSLAFLDGCVYAGALDGAYECVKLKTGDVVWQESVGQDVKFNASAAASPQGVVFVSENGDVLCRTPADGKELWSAEVKEAGDACPAIVGDRVFIGSGSGILYALSMKDGKVVWEFKAGGSIAAGPAIGRGRLVVGTSDGNVFCLGEKKP